MDEPRAERCETCRFWKRQAPDTEAGVEAWHYGECLRYPPQVMALGAELGANARFPETARREWCGEWRAKDGGEWRSVGVGSAGLSSRATNALLRCDVATLGDLADHTAHELMDLGNFGAHSLAKVRAALARYGAKLRGD